MIFTHHPRDYSTDHNMTSKLVTQVLLRAGDNLSSAGLPPIEKKPQVFFFTAGGNIECHPRAYVDVTDVMDIKKQMLLCHESQREWMQEFKEEDFCDAMVGVCRLMGIQAGFEYAEGFTALDFAGYRGDYRLLP